MTGPEATGPILTFCIPTHDGRGPFLREALESILSQAAEIAPGCLLVSISDNASQDDTRAVVADFQSRFPGTISYRRNETNLGFTENMCQAVAGATGDYCWLFSSDDRLAPGGVRRVWEVLVCAPETAGITVNFSVYDRWMNQRQQDIGPLLQPLEAQREMVFQGLPEILLNCGAMMGYVSGQVFRRDLWRRAVAETELLKLQTAGFFPYTLLIVHIVQQKPVWAWLPEVCVEHRSDNDSVNADTGKNLVSYQSGILRSMAFVWRNALGRSRIHRTLLRRSLQNSWRGRQIIFYKMHSRPSLMDEVRMLTTFIAHLWFLPEFWIKTFPCLLLPRPALQIARHFSTPLRYALRRIRHQETNSVTVTKKTTQV